MIDPATGSASRASLLPHPVHDVAGGVTGGRPAVFGGGSGSAVDAVQLVAANGSASIIGHLPQPRADVSSAMAGTTVFLAGGHLDGRWTDQVARFTPSTGTLNVVGHLPRPVSDIALAVVAQTAYVLGGEAAPNTPVATVTELRAQ